jgi:hypothetical protein
VINGHHYFTQDEFSNASYALNQGDINYAGGVQVIGCIQRANPSVPSVATNLQVVNQGGSQLFSWSPPANNGGSPVTGYTVYEESAPNTWAAVATNIPGTSFTNSSVTAGVTYIYNVVAINAVGRSAWAISVWRAYEPTGGPSVATNLQVANQSGSQLFSWSPRPLAMAARR